MPTTLFDDDDFRRAFADVLGAARRGASDVGEALATAARIEDGDAEAWVLEWVATAGAAWAAAGAATDAGRRASARAHLLRAATYYATALRLIDRSAEAGRRLELWRRQRACWDRAAALFPVPAQQLAIPYAGTTLPGYFFAAPDAAPGEPRPLVVMSNGADQATSQMWALGGAAAAERGYHWMTYDGPGQQAARFEQGLLLRPDWDAVLTPVLDAMIARTDVDGARIAVIGVGEGGFWVPRALASERRPAAAVADPGVVDVSAAWTARLAEPMAAFLRTGADAAFERELRLLALFDPAAAAALRARAAPYGAGLAAVARDYRLGDLAAAITTPLLVTGADGETRWPGQSQALYERLPGEKALADLGACGAVPRETAIFDWLDRRLADGQSSWRAVTPRFCMAR